MKTLQNKDRKFQTDRFLKSIFYRDYFKPFLEEKIKSVMSIKRIDTGDIEKSYLKQKVKLDIYEGIFKRLQQWSKEK